MGLPWALGHVNSSLLGTTDTVLQFWGLNSERCTCYTKAKLNTKSSAGTIFLSCVRRLCAHMLTQASDNLGVLFGNPVHLLWHDLSLICPQLTEYTSPSGQLGDLPSSWITSRDLPCSAIFVSVHGVKFGRACFFALTDSDTVWMLTCLLYWTIGRCEFIKQKLRKQLGFQCKLVIAMGLCLLKFLNSEIISAFQRTYNAWRNSPWGSSVLSLSCYSFS